MAGSLEKDAVPDDGRDETEGERLDRNWNELLQELRVIQTGTQILTGFLLAASTGATSTKSSFEPETPGARSTRGCSGLPSETTARSPLGAGKRDAMEPGAGTVQSMSASSRSRRSASSRGSPSGSLW